MRCFCLLSSSAQVQIKIRFRLLCFTVTTYKLKFIHATRHSDLCECGSLISEKSVHCMSQVLWSGLQSSLSSNLCQQPDNICNTRGFVLCLTFLNICGRREGWRVGALIRAMASNDAPTRPDGVHSDRTPPHMISLISFPLPLKVLITQIRCCSVWLRWKKRQTPVSRWHMIGDQRMRRWWRSGGAASVRQCSPAPN